MSDPRTSLVKALLTEMAYMVLLDPRKDTMEGIDSITDSYTDRLKEVI